MAFVLSSQAALVLGVRNSEQKKRPAKQLRLYITGLSFYND